jgi:hypothetical protein
MQSWTRGDGDRQPENRREAISRVPISLLSKIGAGATLVAAFIHAAYEPGSGLGAIKFWLLLFFAAATNQPSDGAVIASEEDVR